MRRQWQFDDTHRRPARSLWQRDAMGNPGLDVLTRPAGTSTHTDLMRETILVYQTIQRAPRNAQALEHISHTQELRKVWSVHLPISQALNGMVEPKIG